MVAIATAAIGMSDHQIVVFNGRTASAYATILYCGRETFENLAKTLSFKQPTDCCTRSNHGATSAQQSVDLSAA